MIQVPLSTEAWLSCSIRPSPCPNTLNQQQTLMNSFSLQKPFPCTALPPNERSSLPASSPLGVKTLSGRSQSRSLPAAGSHPGPQLLALRPTQPTHGAIQQGCMELTRSRNLVRHHTIAQRLPMNDLIQLRRLAQNLEVDCSPF